MFIKFNCRSPIWNNIFPLLGFSAISIFKAVSHGTIVTYIFPQQGIFSLSIKYATVLNFLNHRATCTYWPLYFCGSTVSSTTTIQTPSVQHFDLRQGGNLLTNWRVNLIPLLVMVTHILLRWVSLNKMIDLISTRNRCVPSSHSHDLKLNVLTLRVIWILWI